MIPTCGVLNLDHDRAIRQSGPRCLGGKTDATFDQIIYRTDPDRTNVIVESGLIQYRRHIIGGTTARCCVGVY